MIKKLIGELTKRGAPDPRTLVPQVADAVLEASVVGSFTKAGYLARSELFDWRPLPMMTGQTVLITGGSTGIGRATAAGLMALDADVIITSRSLERASDVAAELSSEVEGGTVVGAAVDTGDLASVRELVRHVRATTTQLDVLINNAGALSNSYQTVDANGPSVVSEATLASHLVGPYLLSVELKPHMVTGGRILWMSSGGMYTQGLDVDTIEMNANNFKGAIAYAKAKRGQVELVAHLAQRWAPEIIMHAMHPGWVATPGVDAGLPGFGKVMGPTLRTAAQGADTMVWLAATGGLDHKPGSFFLDRQARKTSYLPGTETTPAERQRLLEWLDVATEAL